MPRSTATGTADVHNAVWFQVKVMLVKLPVLATMAGGQRRPCDERQCGHREAGGTQQIATAMIGT